MRKIAVLAAIAVTVSVLIAVIFTRDSLPSGTRAGLRLFVISDLHHLSKKLHDYGEAYQDFIATGDGKLLQYTEELLDTLAFELASKPRDKKNILIVSGDLTTNGERIGHLDLADKFKKIEEAGTEVLVIPGNHDINNIYARSFSAEKYMYTDYVTPKQFEDIYEDFGLNEAISRDRSSLSYVAAPSADLRVFMLDSSKYDRNIFWNVSQSDGELAKETLEWIRAEAEKAREAGAEIIAVTHHNVMDHNESLRVGFTMNNAAEVQEVLAECKIPLVFSGHIHAQDIAEKTVDDYVLTEVVTEATGIWPHQYGQLEFPEVESIEYRTAELDVEAYAEAAHLNDEIFSRFAEWSRKSFYDRSYFRTLERLREETSLTAEDKEAMADVNATVNSYFFAGREFEVAEEIKNSYGYKKWIEYRHESSTYYLSSIVHGEDSLDTELSLGWK